jgi:dienelactone hydrolase
VCIAAAGVSCKTAPARGAARDATPSMLAEEVTFTNGPLTLRGVLYKPAGPGPFPAVLYNHGSAPGMLNSQAFDAIGPQFAARGWVFFGPYRRGQGLSAQAGPYIGDQLDAAQKKGGVPARAAEIVRLLEGDHLSDQLAALAWLRRAAFVRLDAIAVAGNSFGGIETVLGVEREPYCAAVDATGAAESWSEAPQLRTTLTRAVRNARAPIFFFQAENDFDLSPTRTLSAAMKDAGKPFEAKIYPPFGSSHRDGHSFAYRGSSIWFDDVFRFLELHCPHDAAPNRALQAGSLRSIPAGTGK